MLCLPVLAALDQVTHMEMKKKIWVEMTRGPSFVQPRISVNSIFEDSGADSDSRLDGDSRSGVNYLQMTTKLIGIIPGRRICWVISLIVASLGLASCAQQPFLSSPPVEQGGNGDLIGRGEYNQFSQEFEEPWPFGRP